MLGRNCRFLQGRDTDPDAVDELRRAIARAGAPRPSSCATTARTARRSGTRSTSRPCATSAARSCASSACRSTSRALPRGAARLDARVAAQAAERRIAFLAEASPLLDASLDLRSTLDSLTRLSVPFLGDVCIVDEIRLNEVRRLAAAAADPAIERLVRELPSRYPVDAGDPVARVVETGRAEIVTGGPASSAGATAGACRPTSPAAMLVPLKARGTIIGIVVFASLDPDRRYGTEDLLLAEDLARRAALALDNARLYEDLGARRAGAAGGAAAAAAAGRSRASTSPRATGPRATAA